MFDYSPGDLFRLTEFVRHSTVARTSSVAGLARDPSTLRGSTVAAGAGAGVGGLNNNRYSLSKPPRPPSFRLDYKEIGGLDSSGSSWMALGNDSGAGPGAGAGSLKDDYASVSSGAAVELSNTTTPRQHSSSTMLASSFNTSSQTTSPRQHSSSMLASSLTASSQTASPRQHSSTTLASSVASKSSV